MTPTGDDVPAFEVDPALVDGLVALFAKTPSHIAARVLLAAFADAAIRAGISRDGAVDLLEAIAAARQWR